MKILILGNSVIGLYKFRKEIVIAFLKEGYEVYISTPKDNDFFVKELEKLGAKFIKTNIDRRGINPIKDLGLFKTYLKIMKDIRPNIVLGYTIKPNLYGSFASQLLNIKYINNITGLGTSLQKAGMLSKVLKNMYKLAFRKSSCIFFQNQENINFFKNNNLIKNKKAILLPGSGVNLEDFYPMHKTIEKSYPVVLFIGRIMKEKGIEEYLEMAKRVIEKGYKVEFQILGQWEEDVWKEKVEEYEKRGWVKYLGISNDVREQIRNCDIVINPSYHEGMSNVLLEAGAMGKLLMGSNISGVKEIIGPVSKELLFEKGKVKNIVEKVENRLTFGPTQITGQKNLEFRIQNSELIEQQMKFINENFSRDIIVGKYMKVIEN